MPPHGPVAVVSSMVGGATLVGTTETTTWFVQRLSHQDTAQVSAVVIWRRPPPAVESRPIGEAVRALLSRRGRAAPAGTAPPPRPILPDGCEASSDLGGPCETLLRHSRRTLAVAGVELPLCDDGRTLVALVDARGSGTPIVRAHVMELAPPPVPPGPWRLLGDGLRARLAGRPAPSTYDVLYPQLFGDPVVAAFLELRDAPRAR